MKKTTPEYVLAAATPAAAAKRLASYLKTQEDTRSLEVWSPEETRERGWGSGWSVAWEEGPHEWAVGLSSGDSLWSGESGYGKPGPFPDGLSNGQWFAEPHNGFILNFHKL